MRAPMFDLACRLTYRAAKAAIVILVLAVIAHSHHAAEDRTKLAELLASAEKAPIAEPMQLRAGPDRSRLSTLLAAADQEVAGMSRP